ncbi:PRD domain-containing protein [Companilactobacillus zhachilii]|uniref:PRD domain-containing protein n=1 Tax=Companilactobacillus zhachilii TaxID=2304606 RepID=UPI00403438C8
MKVIKKINHNAVLISDSGVEKIALGKGIGFSAKPNDLFEENSAEKIFILDSKEKTKMFSEMVNQIPMEYIEFSEDIINYISNRISKSLDSNIYIALTDHIYFAIQRQADDANVAAIMLPEMRMLYPDEFKTSTGVVDLINKKYHTNLADNEIGFITMHIVNAELGERNSFNSLKIMEVTKYILNYLDNNGYESLDKNSFLYNRLMIHIRFLVQRLIYHETTENNDMQFFNDSFKHSKEYHLATKIAEVLEKRYELTANENEELYLAIHLMRINNNRA